MNESELNLQNTEIDSETDETDIEIENFLNHITEVADSSIVTSGILHLSLLNPLGILRTDGKNNETILDQTHWKQLYFELYEGVFSTDSMKSLEEIEIISRSYKRDGLVPILLAHYRFHTLGQYLANLMETQQYNEFTLQKSYELREAIQEKTSFFSTAYLPSIYKDYSLVPYVHHGLSVNFILTRETYLTNIDSPLEKLAIDFDDGKGYHDVSFDKVIQIIYPKTGIKYIKIRAESAGSTLESQFMFYIKEAISIPRVDLTWTNLQFPIEL